MNRRWILNMSLVSIWLFCSGCSIVWSITAPGPKDLDVMSEGKTRLEVASELGEPVSSEQGSGYGRVERYRFEHGWPFWFNGIRALAYGAGDFFTLGLAEIVQSPLEKLVFRPDDMTAEVTFSSADVVVRGIVMDSDGEVVFDSLNPVEDESAELADTKVWGGH